METVTLLLLGVLTFFAVNVLVRFSLHRRGALSDKADAPWPVDVRVFSLGGIVPQRQAKWLYSTVYLLAVIVWQMFANLISKFILCLVTLYFAIFSSELKGMDRLCADGPHRPDWKKLGPGPRRTIIFIRHGESLWNQTFNRGFGLSFPFRLLTFLGWEAALSCEPDSVIVDSPLSTEGVMQSYKLMKWIQDPTSAESDGEEKDLDAKLAAYQKETQIALAGGANSVVVVSNLRRAISTGLIALGSRLLSNPSEQVIMNSSLQEATRNPDGMSLAARKSVQNPPDFEKSLSALRLGDFYSSRIDPAYNEGNKPAESRLAERLQQFASWSFQAVDSSRPLVVVGHSGWFRYFFRRYLAADNGHPIKHRKLENCSVVRCDLMKLSTPDGMTDFHIPEESVAIVYGGLKKGTR